MLVRAHLPADSGLKVRLIQPSERTVVVAAELAVFGSADRRPSTRVRTFVPSIARRMVLTFGATLSSHYARPYANAVCKAACAVGDDELFYRPGMGALPENPEHQQMLGVAFSTNPNSQDFAAPDAAALQEGFNLFDFRGIEDHVISPSGKWGMAFDEDFWAIVGGTDRFMAVLAAHLPRSPEEELREHMKWCRYVALTLYGGRPSAWIAQHVAYLAGRERAEQLLAEFEIPVPPDAL